MQRQLTILTGIAIAVSLGACSQYTENSGDWHQYLGPNRTAVVDNAGLLQTWPDSGLQEVWRKPLGSGYSGMVVAGQQLYTMHADSSYEYLVCLDAGSGEEIWQLKTDSVFVELRNGSGPRSTPTIDGGMIYAIGAHGRLLGVDRHKGSIIWDKHLKQDFQSKGPSDGGYACSPLVRGNMLFVEAGGENGNAFVALDKNNGDLFWKSQSDSAGFSSPSIMTLGGVEQVVFFSASGLVSLDANKGDLLWRYPWTTQYNINATAPLYVAPDKVLFGSGYDNGSALLQITNSDSGFAASEVWKTRDLQSYWTTSVIHDGHIYGFHRGLLTCVTLDSGKEVWKHRGFGVGSIILADGQLLVLGQKGNLALAKASPDSFQEISNMKKVLDGKRFHTPATLAHGKLYIRHETELICLDIAAQG